MAKDLMTELRAFCETTSVRGIPRVMKAKTRVTFVVWLLTVLTCAGLLVWQLSVVLTRYAQFPVNTLTVQAPASQNPTFPDITLCNLNPLVYADFNLTFSDYCAAETNYDWYSEVKSMGYPYMSMRLNELKSFLCRLTTYLNQFPLANCFEFTENMPMTVQCTYFYWGGFTQNTDCMARMSVAWDPIYYKCFTLRLDDSSRENVRGFSAILYIDSNNENQKTVDIDQSFGLSHANGMRMLVHAPGTAPDMSLGMNVGSGTETFVLLRQTKRTRLAHPYSNCTGQQHLTEDDTSAAYTLRHCLNTCDQQNYVDVCGCVSSTVPQYSMAQLRQTNFSVCGNASEDFLKNYVCAYRSTILDFVPCNSVCRLPCDEINYDAIPSSAPWPQASVLKAYADKYILLNPYFNKFNPLNNATMDKMFVPFNDSTLLESTITHGAAEKFFASNFLQLNVQFGDASFSELKDVAAFSVDVMGAQIGGVLSLWLGVTVMFLSEAFEFLYIYFTDCRRTESTQGDLSISRAAEMVSTSVTVQTDDMVYLSRADLDSLLSKFKRQEHCLYVTDL